MVPVQHYLIVSALLFAIGATGLFFHRNLVSIFLCIELMLNAVNINLVAFEAMWLDSMALGQIFSIFIITVAAAEVGIGLAIVLMIFRNSHSANLDDFATMKG